VEIYVKTLFRSSLLVSCFSCERGWSGRGKHVIRPDAVIRVLEEHSRCTESVGLSIRQAHEPRHDEPRSPPIRLI